MKSELIEKLNSLTSAVLEHRQESKRAKLATLEELKCSTKKFYGELWERYQTLLENTRQIYNKCTQYVVHTDHGDLEMGLAATGFFSSIAGWGAYSFGSFTLVYRNEDGNIDCTDKKGLLRLKNFLDNADWADFDKQITEQAVKLFGQYEEDTLKEEL